MTSSICSIKKENCSGESLENTYSSLCLDLNMDIETKSDAWQSYEHIRKHYVLEGDQLHWLAVSLYVSCRKNKYLLKSSNNPISISRLLKSANQLELMIFFDKLHKWEDMANLPDLIRKKIDQVEHAFNISSILFEKYLNIFLWIFNGNEQKLISFDYFSQRTLNQINPKLNQKNKEKTCSIYHLYSLIWTIYALAKTIYPATFNDLIASFHLLIASFEFIYQISIRDHLQHLIKDECIYSNGETIIDKLCEKYSCSSEMCRSIYEEHLKNELFNRFNIELNDINYFNTIKNLNKEYDEIVLTNCIIDERIFLENKRELFDLLNPLNENRNSRNSTNKTPLTANQHLTLLNQQMNSHLTPISQANHLIQILYSIIGQQTNQPNSNLLIIIGQQHFLDDLVERINQWEKIYLNEYNSHDSLNIFQENSQSNLCQLRFNLALKLFYNALENILIIEKKRLLTIKYSDKQIQESFHKLILNNEFLKSLVGLCLLLVFYSHNDMYHDLNWILNLYSLEGYSFLKILQIYLKTIKQITKSRSFIKYFSSIEEKILSSMAFSSQSAFWNDIQSKGFISYQQIQEYYSPIRQTPTNLSSMYFQSPNLNQVSRKLFQTSTTEQSNNCLSIIRSRSDPLNENVKKPIGKCSPYTMFYRRYYQLVLSRLDLLCLRLFGCQSNDFEKSLWNFFLYLFENFTQLLFESRDLDQILLSSIYYLANYKQEEQLTWSRLIQAYKSIPNSKLKTLRSVFIRLENSNETFSNEISSNENPCLTPSKPAGTIHRIDGKIFGDITTFYKEVFLKIPNLEKEYFSNEFLDFPIRRKTLENQNEHLSIHLGEKIFVDYSSNQIKSSSTNFNFNSLSNSSNLNQHSNVLSSSIQAGLNNTVQTTRIRTDDGKFLTTISTIKKLNNQDEKLLENSCEKNLFFGQSSNHSIKRTLSNDSNSNCLTSLTKKVLQIENDRQKLQEN